MGNTNTVLGHQPVELEGVVPETRAHDLCSDTECEYYVATNLLLGS